MSIYTLMYMYIYTPHTRSQNNAVHVHHFLCLYTSYIHIFLCVCACKIAQKIKPTRESQKTTPFGHVYTTLSLLRHAAFPYKIAMFVCMYPCIHLCMCVNAYMYTVRIRIMFLCTTLSLSCLWHHTAFPYLHIWCVHAYVYMYLTCTRIHLCTCVYAYIYAAIVCIYVSATMFARHTPHATYTLIRAYMNR